MTPQEFATSIKAKYPQYKNVDDLTLAQKMVEKYPQYKDHVSFEQPEEPGIVGKAWDALAVPEQKSREGLNMLAGMVPYAEPTGNAFRDVGLNTPKILADSVAEVAPGFVSRGSILTAGALKGAQYAAPFLKLAGTGLANQLESASGIAPKDAGALGKAFEDVTQFFAKGTKSANPLYEAAKAEVPQGTSIFAEMYKPEEILDTAKEFLKNGGKLEPAEAHVARKAIDKLMSSGRYVKDELITLRKTFDEMAKASSKIGEADQIFSRGRTAEALRNLFPQNKMGGASAFKAAILAATGGMGAPLLSPAVQGIGATGLGVASKIATPFVNNPLIGTVLGSGRNILKRRTNS